MTKSPFRLGILFLSFLIFNGCFGTDSDPQPTTIKTAKSYPLVDEALWPLFEKFETEAKLRGRTIDLAAQQIKATIDNVPAPHVGLCNRTTNERVIIIDPDFWVSRNEFKLELLVFHELGHCSLNLGHQEDKAGGICKSIMRSGLGGCIDNYNANNRGDYLDDLFLILD